MYTYGIEAKLPRRLQGRRQFAASELSLSLASITDLGLGAANAIERDHLEYHHTSEKHQYQLDLVATNCLVIARCSNGDRSGPAVRDRWRRISQFVQLNHACHFLYVRQSDPASSETQINQLLNIVNGMSIQFKEVVSAIAEDPGGSNDMVFSAGVLKSHNLDGMFFASEERALEWLSKQKHREGCCYQ